MNYEIPKPPRKLNPRAVHLYDIIAFVFMLLVALRVLPLEISFDFSAGIFGKSELRKEYDSNRFHEAFASHSIPLYELENLFESTTIQNGGYVYWSSMNRYYCYQNGEKGLNYYHINFDEDTSGKILTLATQDVTPGLIDKGYYITVGEDGRIFFDNGKKYSGWTDIYVNPDTADPAEISKMLAEEEIGLENLALVWTLIQNGTLVGYYNDTSWFYYQENGMHKIMRGTASGVEEILSIDGDVSNVMVAFNQFLFYERNGNVHARNLEINKGVYLPYAEDWPELGEVKQLAYVKLSNGKIRLYTLNDVTCTYTDFTGNGIESEMTTTLNKTTGKNYSGIFTTKAGTTSIVWFQDGQQLVRIVEGG